MVAWIDNHLYKYFVVKAHMQTYIYSPGQHHAIISSAGWKVSIPLIADTINMVIIDIQF